MKTIAPVAPLPSEDLAHVVNQVGAGWEELREKRIFITGGTGFFGFWLLESLLAADRKFSLGMDVTVLSRNPDAFAAKAPHLCNQGGMHLLKGDVRHFIFPSGEFSHVIHAATESSANLNSENPLEMLSVIVEGTRHVLDFATQAKTQKFLLTSSGAVYGKQPPEISHLREEYGGAPDLLDPASAYGQGKRMAEHLTFQYSRKVGFEAKIARCFAFVGPHLPLDAHFAIGNFIRDAIEGRTIQIQGDGTPCRSYLYAADLAIWLMVILKNGKTNTPYNVGSDDALSIDAVAQHVAKALGDHGIQKQFEPLPSAPTSRYVPCVDRARQDLGLAVWTPLDEAIKKTARYHHVASH